MDIEELLDYIWQEGGKISATLIFSYIETYFTNTKAIYEDSDFLENKNKDILNLNNIIDTKNKEIVCITQQKQDIIDKKNKEINDLNNEIKDKKKLLLELNYNIQNLTTKMNNYNNVVSKIHPYNIMFEIKMLKKAMKGLHFKYKLKYIESIAIKQAILKTYEQNISLDN